MCGTFKERSARAACDCQVVQNHACTMNLCKSLLGCLAHCILIAILLAKFLNETWIARTHGSIDVCKFDNGILESLRVKSDRSLTVGSGLFLVFSWFSLAKRVKIEKLLDVSFLLHSVLDDIGQLGWMLRPIPTKPADPHIMQCLPKGPRMPIIACISPAVRSLGLVLVECSLKASRWKHFAAVTSAMSFGRCLLLQASGHVQNVVHDAVGPAKK